MPRYICIHGHFYQPPRENPWLEKVELQESAAPWHDWNERISAQCYSRNAASRILNGNGEIIRICNNYSRMSFNIGPTLLSWLKENDNLCYQSIIEADFIGRKKFSGHGPAMAQVYNHIIMPLANQQDKITQVKWGIADFESRFERKPEGMWLAECAVDTDTLEILAANKIKFTVLSPYQAKATRMIGYGDWQDVTGARVDTRIAYKCNLPSGHSIAIFFYDGVLSQKIAFGGLLDDGGNFARALINAHADNGPVLSHVATDGESYGHHHEHGDMALAYCLDYIDKSVDAQLTVYGEFLEFYPPEFEVQIIENSSWSCAHGVERWRSDCSCGDGTPGYHHRWRKPLRDAMNFLRDGLAEIFEEKSEQIFKNAWNARNNYIDVILNRTPENVNEWLKNNTVRNLNAHEKILALSLMEMERNSLLMFTSCGWFFDEISRIEPVQVMRYAAKAIELARSVSGKDLEPDFLKILAEAPSNIPELQNGAKIYELRARQDSVNPKTMAAYYGITSLLKDYGDKFSEGCWDLSGSSLLIDDDLNTLSKEFSAGIVKVRSQITYDEGEYLFAVKHDGGTSILCGVSELSGSASPLTMSEVEELKMLFDSGGKTFIEKFGYLLYTLTNIPADERRHLVNELLRQDVEKLEDNIRTIVDNNDNLLEYLNLLGARPPAIMTVAAQFTLTSDLVKKLNEPVPDATGIRRLFELAGFWQVKPDEEKIRFAFSECINRILRAMYENGADINIVKNVRDLINILSENFKWHLSLYEAQNLYYELVKNRGLKKYQEPLRSDLYELGRSLYFSEEFLK